MNEQLAVITPRAVTVHDLDAATLESLVVNGDCAKLSPEQRVMYYRARCEAAGLDYRTQPFQFINLQGKLVMYALKAATDQLASLHGIVSEIVQQQTEDGIRTVTVRSHAKDGRQTDEIGCVTVAGKKGDELCNAYMKAVTKAKRRAILSLCGLGMTDETELETIHGVAAADPTPPPAAQEPPRKSARRTVDVKPVQQIQPAAPADLGSVAGPTPMRTVEPLTPGSSRSQVTPAQPSTGLGLTTTPTTASRSEAAKPTLALVPPPPPAAPPAMRTAYLYVDAYEMRMTTPSAKKPQPQQYVSASMTDEDGHTVSGLISFHAHVIDLLPKAAKSGQLCRAHLIDQPYTSDPTKSFTKIEKLEVVEIADESAPPATPAEEPQP